MKLYLKDAGKVVVLDDGIVRAYHEFLGDEEFFREGVAENTAYSMIQASCHKDPREAAREMTSKQVAEMIEQSIRQEVIDIAGADAWEELRRG